MYIIVQRTIFNNSILCTKGVKWAFLDRVVSLQYESKASASASRRRVLQSHKVKRPTKSPVHTIFFHTPCAKCHFAHARVKQRGLNQALHTSYEKIVFDTRVRKWFYPRVAFSPSLRSGANVLTRIKALFRTCIENNYFFNFKPFISETSYANLQKIK